MGRPSSCGCCGTVAPSSVCFNTAGYDQTPWVVQTKTANVSGQFIPNDGNPSIIPSGDKIVLRWEEPDSITTPPTGNICTNSPEKWFPHSSGGYLLDQYYRCSGFFYEYVITKECYIPSGVKVYGKIAALTSFVNAKISLNDGQERIITQFYESSNPDSVAINCCAEKFCDYNYITTNNSGCYRITVSGSTTNRDLVYEEIFIAGSGAIDFFVGVSGNHNSVGSRWNCDEYLDYPFFTCQSCNEKYCCTCCEDEVYLGKYNGLQTEIDCSSIATANNCGTNWTWTNSTVCGDLHSCCIPQGPGNLCQMLTCEDCAELGGTTNYGFSCSGPGPIIICAEEPV